MITYNEVRQITAPVSTLDTLGYTAGEKTKMEEATIFRTISHDGDCNLNIHFEPHWSVRVSGELPGDTIENITNKLWDVSLKSLRGTMGQPVTQQD